MSYFLTMLAAVPLYWLIGMGVELYGRAPVRRPRRAAGQGKGRLGADT